MKNIEPKIPKNLHQLQDWFGQIITSPMLNDDSINPVTSSGTSIQKEAEKYIKPSKTLKPFERMELYNQQYWWRLRSILHENFPLTVRLLGYYCFNQEIATPYLFENPPSHWSLNYLGNTLPRWLEKNYQEEDKLLVESAALVDHAYIHSFISKELKPIDFITAMKEDANSSILNKKISLQPHISLIELKLALLPYRDEVLVETPEYWQDHPLPPLKKGKRFCYVIYRDLNNTSAWKEISYEQMLILKQFKQSNTIESFCAWLESQKGTLLEQASENLHQWFQDWTKHGFLGADS